MKLMQLTFKKCDFDAISTNEQIFLVHLTWLYTETMILRKLLIISGNNLNDLQGVTKTANRVQSLFFIRSLAGKLYEGWNILQESYFNRSNPQSLSLKEMYVSKLTPKACEAFQLLSEYFGQGDNIIKDIRNKYSFHFDRNRTENLLQQLNPDEQLTAFVAEEAGNCLYVFSDDLTTHSLLDSIDSSDHQNAMNQLFGEVLKVAKWFDVLTHEIVMMMLDPCNFEDEEISLENIRNENELELPFFLNRSSVE